MQQRRLCLLIVATVIAACGTVDEDDDDDSNAACMVVGEPCAGDVCCPGATCVDNPFLQRTLCETVCTDDPQVCGPNECCHPVGTSSVYSCSQQAPCGDGGSGGTG